jgi:hypothetical protein
MVSPAGLYHIKTVSPAEAKAPNHHDGSTALCSILSSNLARDLFNLPHKAQAIDE